MKDAKIALLLLGGSLLWHTALFWSWVYREGPDEPFLCLVELYLPMVLAAFPLLCSVSRTGKRTSLCATSGASRNGAHGKRT